ncbi:MAG: HAD-IB family hydrolase [Parachlamydia sp.]|nr:HAD-IB family hydrolase [Parachlamydia sp.]
MNTQKPVVAAFDFDGTLTRCDSLVPFLFFTFGPLKTIPGLIAELPSMIAFLLNLRSRQATKEKILTRFLKGIPGDILRRMGREYAEKGLHKILKSDSMQKLRWHQVQGHRCILISASIDLYLQPWADTMGFHDILTSRLAYDQDGRATGLVQGINCWGAEKTRRLTELMGPKEAYILYAYGDSAGDRELLALADHPFKI